MIGIGYGLGLGYNARYGPLMLVNNIVGGAFAIMILVVIIVVVAYMAYAKYVDSRPAIVEKIAENIAKQPRLVARTTDDADAYSKAYPAYGVLISGDFDANNTLKAASESEALATARANPDKIVAIVTPPAAPTAYMVVGDVAGASLYAPTVATTKSFIPAIGLHTRHATAHGAH